MGAGGGWNRESWISAIADSQASRGTKEKKKKKKKKKKEEEEEVYFILPEIVPELFGPNEPWI